MHFPTLAIMGVILATSSHAAPLALGLIVPNTTALGTNETSPLLSANDTLPIQLSRAMISTTSTPPTDRILDPATMTPVPTRMNVAKRADNDGIVKLTDGGLITCLERHKVLKMTIARMEEYVDDELIRAARGLIEEQTAIDKAELLKATKADMVEKYIPECGDHVVWEC